MLGVVVQLFLIFVITCLTITYFYFNRNYGYWKKRGVPYEEPTLFFGNLSFLMRRSFWDVLYDLSKKFKGDYFGMFLAWKPTLIVQSKELAKQVLVKNSNHFQDRYSYAGLDDDPLGSLNLFSVKNPLWLQMRTELTPMFTSLRLKGVTELMNINSAELVRRIQRDYVENNEPVNLMKLFTMYTSDTIGFSVFGIQVSALQENDSPLWYITRHMVDWNFWRGFEYTSIMILPAIAKFLRLKLFSQPATDYIKKLFWDVVEERKKTSQTNDRDLVSHLLKIKANLKLPAEAGTELADNLMLAQVAVFILGAIETSPATLCYCLHELAYHPNEQEKLYEEISKELRASGKDILDYDHLFNLKYLSACIYETLRKHPPVPHLDRFCNETTKLTDELTVERGTPVFVNVVGIHHNEEYYPEPEEWRPERFINSSENDNHDFKYLPFGEGPRYCIGKRYAMMQIRAAIAQMITKYRFETDEPRVVKKEPYSFLLVPKSGGRIKFIPRS